jgi:hypothetical protein
VTGRALAAQAKRPQALHAQPHHRVGYTPSRCNTAKCTAPGTTPEGYHSDHRVRSRRCLPTPVTRSTARYCAIAQPSVKQIDGTTTRDARASQGPAALTSASNPERTAGHLAAAQCLLPSGARRVAAAPTPADTRSVAAVHRLAAGKTSLPTPLLRLRSQGAQVALGAGEQPAVSARAPQPRARASPCPTLKAARGDAVSVQVVLRNPAGRCDGGLGSGESQLGPLGAACCHEDAAQVCKKMAAGQIARPGTTPGGPTCTGRLAITIVC